MNAAGLDGIFPEKAYVHPTQTKAINCNKRRNFLQVEKSSRKLVSYIGSYSDFSETNYLACLYQARPTYRCGCHINCLGSQ